MPKLSSTTSLLSLAIGALVAAGCAHNQETVMFTVGERETVATLEQRVALGLQWFMDGNMGVAKAGDRFHFYGANGPHPMRTTGTPLAPLQEVEPVAISSENEDFDYLAGGPIYHDAQSDRLFLFYHAEIHRGTGKNFYSVLGLAVQTDEEGLEFKDLGPIFVPNLPNEDADDAVEICGAPYLIIDGHFYVYARDVLTDGKHVNLTVARAPVGEVVDEGLQGRSAEWRKYYDGAFSEPGVGGRSTPLEPGNPGTRWMDLSYNTALEKYIMVVAQNTSRDIVDLFLTWSKDGLVWARRRKIASGKGESFYPSIVGFEEDLRQTGSEFFIYYTFSKAGGWNRWEDAEIVRRKVVVTKGKPHHVDAGDGR